MKDNKQKKTSVEQPTDVFETKQVDSSLEMAGVSVAPVEEAKIKAYEPTEEAKKMPRRLLHKGVWVAIGGDIEMVGEPPKIPYIVKEATQKQYEDLYEEGYRHLIKFNG